MAIKSNWFKTKLRGFQSDFDYRLEKLILDVTEKISKRMKQKRLSRVKFAEKLEVSPPAVTKILDGNSNFTLRTLLSLADALELNLNIEFKEEETAIHTSLGSVTSYSSISANDYAVMTYKTNDIACGISGLEEAA